jgi:FKBP-type peptidyl-prolyl cis-trans isomerase
VIIVTRLALALLLALAFGLAACDGNGGEVAEVSPTMGSADGPPPVSGQPTVTDSGLQIIDIEVGPGAAAERTSKVTVHYTGWLADGTMFDSSLDRDQPITFSLAHVFSVAQAIPGWQEGILGMKVGGKRRLIVPPDLAYGESGSGSIPPNAELTFDIELVQVR